MISCLHSSPRSSPQRRRERGFAKTARASSCRAGILLVVATTVFCPFWSDLGPVHSLLPKAGAAESRLNAADILRGVREAQAGKREKLLGQLRTGEGKVFPFALISDGPRIRYQFQPPAPAETVQVRLLDENSQLEAITDAGTEKLTPVNFDKRVLGTDLAYEDLALRFLYWSRASIVDEERVKTRPAWKLRLDAPGRRSQYSSVNLWVDKESGALLRAEGYDWNGSLVKRFEVVSAQKINGAWYLKQMRIESLDAAAADGGGGKVRSRTYLEIKGVAR